MAIVEPKVIFLGDYYAGKTSFLLKAAGNEFKTNKNLRPDIRSGFTKFPIQINETIVNLQIWDTVDSEKYVPISPIYFKDAAVAIFIFSLNIEETFNLIPKYFDLLKQNSKKFPILFLIGNLNDLDKERVISSEQGQQAADEMNAYYYEISSKTGAGVEDAIKQIAIQSLNFGKAKLLIKSIKIKYDFQKLKYPLTYLTFTVGDITKQTKPIENCIDPKWTEPIDFLIDFNKDILKISIFNKSSKSEIKLTNDIEISMVEIPNIYCFQRKYYKDISIKKDFFSKKEIGQITINFKVINLSIKPPKNPTIHDVDSSDEEQTNSEVNSVNTKEQDEKHSKIEFKFIDGQSFEELLKFKKKIGIGATSTVYKVKNIFDGKGHLAIKMLNSLFFQLMKPNTADDIKIKKDFWNDDDDDDDDDQKEEEEEEELHIEEVQRLYNEWEFLSQLDHPNIIKSYGIFIGDKTHSPSIVLEYCKCNLEEAILHLENIDLVKVVYQICKAMQYLHDHNIIHRDLKVKNILINAQKNVKICDFGISKFIDITNLSSMTHCIGTFIYMAPELFNIESRIDEKIDVYAFGVVLYFIVTKGELPVFDQNNPLENHKIPGSVNEISQSIIKKCWSFSPENRPSFKSIIDTIVSNNFHLFDDVNESISSLNL